LVVLARKFFDLIFFQKIFVAVIKILFCIPILVFFLILIWQMMFGKLVVIIFRIILGIILGIIWGILMDIRVVIVAIVRGR